MSIRLSVIVCLCIFASAVSATESIELPNGFAIEEFASVPNARSLALGDDGTLFVSNRRGKSVYAVTSDGENTRTIELLKGLNSPNGIALHEGYLYVAEIDRVTRYANIEDSLEDVPQAEVLDIDLPSDGWHGWRYIGFGPDDKLYVSIGAPCNVCEEDGYANIVRMNPDGSDREVYASGIRNSVGFTWHPDTGHLWFTDNGRDMLGDDLPADELNKASGPGQHFGFPYCHAGELADPEFGSKRECAEFVAPAQKLGAHVAALGIAFYQGEMLPSQYHGQLFIAEHGSWNRSEKSGYRITRVQFEDGVAVAYEPFATGWLKNGSVSGRPVDIVEAADGALLVSDDKAGKIYRISYTK